MRAEDGIERNRHGGRGVFVLGMHRAGTSALARAVNLLGVPLAQRDALKTPSSANPSGFWEVQSLIELNDALLFAMGGHWSSPPPLDGRSLTTILDSCREHAVDVFTAAHPTREWAWKDPRNCLLLGFWTRALSVDPVVVLIHRDPLEIAASLARRDGISAPMAIALWEAYLRSALRHCAGSPVLVVRFDRLVDEPHRFQEVGRGFLRDHGLTCAVDDSVDVSTAVHAQMRHHRRDRPRGCGDAGLTVEQHALVAALLELEGAHPKLGEIELGPQTPETATLLDARRDAVLDLTRTRMKLRDRDSKLEDRDSKLEELHDKLEGLHERHRSLREKLEEEREKAHSGSDA